MLKYFAHHESGHAVAMVKLGIPIERMSLEKFEEGGHGGVKPVAGGCADYYKHAVAYAAGPLAGDHYIDTAEAASVAEEDTFATDRLYHETGSGSDWDRAKKCAEHAGKTLLNARRAAADLIVANWSAIRAVAEEFDRSEILTGAEVEEIVSRFN
ncbi:hypothetical protein ACFVYA_13610 [Amycolatopsis sp. NPDC058278]|uniref:hypothetical protein n=1 Tax=Amycolatopsis sp. NPDC058278 TaxID=3346417 RepID=UPI0036D90BA5